MPDPESLVATIGSLTPLAVASMVLAGLLVGVAPSSFPLISVSAGLGAASESVVGQSRAVWLALGFVLGIVTVDAALGAIFGFVGFAAMRAIAHLLAPAFGMLAALLGFIGLALLRVVRVRLPVLTPAPRLPSTFLQAYLLGLPFGLSSCPACTPLLLPVLATAAFSADPLLGAVLMLAFGAGRGVPVVAAGAASGMLRRLLHSWIIVERFERAAGILFLTAAGYFAFQALRYAGWLPT